MTRDSLAEKKIGTIYMTHVTPKKQKLTWHKSTMIESLRARWFLQYSSATTSSRRPSASLMAIYGLDFTRFKSSWSPSNKKERNSYIKNMCIKRHHSMCQRGSKKLFLFCTMQQDRNLSHAEDRIGGTKQTLESKGILTCESCWL